MFLKWLLPCLGLLQVGCGHCREEYDSTLELRDDELGEPCGAVCGQAIEDVYGAGDYQRCTLGTNDAGAPTAICTYLAPSTCNANPI